MTRGPEPSEPAPEPPLGFLLSHLAGVLREDTAKALTDVGLSPRDFGVLWRLATHGPLSQRELGTLHQIDRTTVVAIIDHLEEAGLVERHVDPRDRRRRALALTDRGRSVLADAEVVVDRVAADFTRPLSRTERRALGATLQTLLAGVVGR